MNRWLPHPLMSVTLMLVWLLLANRFSLAHLFMGALLGTLIPHFTGSFWPERPRLHRPLLLMHYLGRLLWDIAVANINVARLILGPQRRLRPAFVELPLAVQDPFAITLLASTVSLTPGTVSADLSADRRTLMIHCLDVENAPALIGRIKARYEAPLMEIFG